MHYPTTRYHRTLAPVTVPDARALHALGAGWEDTPAMFHAHGELAEGATHCAECGLARERFAEDAAERNDAPATFYTDDFAAAEEDDAGVTATQDLALAAPLLSRADVRAAKRAARLAAKA